MRGVLPEGVVALQEERDEGGGPGGKLFWSDLEHSNVVATEFDCGAVGVLPRGRRAVLLTIHLLLFEGSREACKAVESGEGQNWKS